MSDHDGLLIGSFLEKAKDAADSMHVELHDLQDPLAHDLSHLLKHVVSLARFVLLESGLGGSGGSAGSGGAGGEGSGRAAPESAGLVERNLASLGHDLWHLEADATEVGDATVVELAGITRGLLDFVQAFSTGAPARDVADKARAVQSALGGTIPLARSDLVARFFHLTLRNLLSAWRVADPDLVGVVSSASEVHDHGHEHTHEHSEDQGHSHGHSHRL
ncbi:MAG: hypothetical protein ACTSU5_02375 [Promethearchaeota archaeon]